MKPIICQPKEAEPTICVDDIKDNHIIVAILSGKPCILGKGYQQSSSKLSFFIIREYGDDSNISIGNGYEYSDEDDTPSKMVRRAMSVSPDNKVAVFEQKYWKEALQWLMDNCD